jgi:alcohol dehydrogenase class IV
MTIIFDVPNRTISGLSTFYSIGQEITELGKKPLLIHTRRFARSDNIVRITEQLQKENLVVNHLTVESGEPTISMVEAGLKQVREKNADVIIGIGGGSILDLAKAVAGLHNAGSKTVKDYFYGSSPSQKGLPWVAIPSTAGTGAEATPNAVLSDGTIKQSIRGSHHWLASLVVLDPQLTIDCPMDVTAQSGMDALTQAIESYTSTGANVFTEPYSLRATKLISKSLLKAYHEPNNIRARSDMLIGSNLAGIALANARLGIVHGVAHSVGVKLNLSHGLVCGILLPWAIEYNREVSHSKYEQLAKEMGIGETCDDLISWIRNIKKKLEIPYSLKELGLKQDWIEEIAKESLPSGSLKANPKPTSFEDLVEFLNKQLN